MQSMYETIMDLPVFKGVSRNQVSAFLEKVHIEFVNYTNGEMIVRAGEQVENIKFIFSGSAILESHNFNNTIKFKELRPAGIIIAGRHIFGMDTRYPYSVKAYGKVSVLQISKEQFFSLLQSDKIYILNMLNYISLHAQRTVNAVRLLTDGSLPRQLGIWLSTMTDSMSTSIEIECTIENLSRLTNLSIPTIESSLETLREHGLATYSDDTLHIPSRANFLDHIEELGQD